MTAIAPPISYRVIFCTEYRQPEIVTTVMRFRKRILVDQRGWLLNVVGDLERDEYDTHATIHGAILRGDTILSCFRLVRTDHPYLAKEKFGPLAQFRPYPQSARVWEISRLAIDPSGRPFELMARTYSAIFNFAISRAATSLVAFAEVAKERLVRSIGITTDLLGEPAQIGFDSFGQPMICVAGELPLGQQSGPRFEKLMKYFDGMEIEDEGALLGLSQVSA